jgi:predicted RNase H-like HicB family nuclease
MLTEYIQAAMGKARYEILDDGTYYGEIPPCRGVWATAKTLEACRRELQEVLEEWIFLKIKDEEEWEHA